MSCFFKTLSGNLLTLSSKTFPQIVKNLCTFLWKDRDVYFYKFEIRFFFSCIFFRLQSKFSRNPGLFFRAALTKQHWILSQEVFFGRRIFFIFFFQVFDCFSQFWPEKERIFGRIFSTGCRNGFHTFQSRSARYIFFQFWKKLSLFSSTFSVFDPFFFKNRPKFSREPCQSWVFESTEKFLRRKFFSGKKLFHFICSRMFERGKIGVMATPFDQDFKIAVFLPRWSLKSIFF